MEETIDRHTHVECLLFLHPRKAALKDCALRTWGTEFGVTGGDLGESLQWFSAFLMLLPLQLLPGLKNQQNWHVKSFPWWDVTKSGRIVPLASVPGVYCLHGCAQGTYVCTHKSTGEPAALSPPLPLQPALSSLSTCPQTGNFQNGRKQPELGGGKGCGESSYPS